MRRRLVITYLVLLALVLVGFELPLAINAASRGTEEMIVDRMVDANRLASIADPALRTGQTVILAAELARYHDLYGIDAAVADRDGSLALVAGAGKRFAAPAVHKQLVQALAGERAANTGVVWPWRSEPLAVAVPVTSGGEVIGAVVTLSPTGRLRGDELRFWILITGVGLGALAVFVVVAFALARWILRPVAGLVGTAQRVAGGAFDARVPVDSGPPELRRLARSFNAMADNVADAFGRQRAFVAQASHQLRNPLAALRIRLDNLADHVGAGGLDEHRETLDEVDRLGLILDGLLALASAERGQHGCQVVDAAAVADQRVAAWQPLAERREITLRRTGAARADARAVVTGVDQALDALIDNALKFAGPGATVLVDVKPGIMSIDIDVVDDGPGLSADERRLAAERFWRAPEAQNVDGAGLGLPIAAVLAEVSGGGLRLLPVSPHGLNAKLTFPTP